MAHKKLLVALSIIAAASPLLAANTQPPPESPTPVADAQGRYCLRVEVTGRIVDAVQCWTREEWAEQDVDVDKEWPKEGVDPRRING